jgi:hypothetical protein
MMIFSKKELENKRFSLENERRLHPNDNDLLAAIHEIDFTLGEIDAGRSCQDDRTDHDTT